MYGLWLFKELKTEYGLCKVEVFRKGYTASAIEIGALVGNSLNLALENLDTITAPIGKSVCSFEIYDTDQLEYDDLFTPDATAYKVVISTRTGKGGGPWDIRWSGYITPDFFAENLSYRTPISISARDNIGYLNDVDFDLDVATITVRELILAAFNRISEDYPMSLLFLTNKQTEEGVLAVDATISTILLREKSWYDAIETILHDLGMQMRWVDNNTIAVFDVSQLGEKFGLQRFNFVENSGYREILPAWRELSQKQDYGLRENFFEGWMKADKLSFSKSQSMTIPDLGFRQDVRYYQPTNWGVARDIYTTDPTFYNTTFNKRLYFSSVSEANPSTTYLSWSTNVLKSTVPLTIKGKALNSVIYPFGGYTPYPLQLKVYDPFLAYAAMEGDSLQIGVRFNLLLHARDNKTYVMNKEWVEDDGTGSGSYINLTLEKVSLDSYIYQEGKGFFPVGSQPQEQEITITANAIPQDGTLELRIYGYYIVSQKYGNQNIQSPNFDKFFTYIDELTYTFEGNDISAGQDARVTIAELHNVKESRDYSFGQVPLDCGGINAYAGGLFKANGDELVGFRRDDSSTTYPLLELVGREIIHFNKKNYTKLSGTAKNLSQEPLMFNKLLVYKGKNYLPYSCSLDVISNTMHITTMQEVEQYMTQSFVEIKSELVTGGGATISGGNNTALQYSAEVGNAKRISELNNASENEKKESYIVVDNASWNESKKVPLSEMEGLDAEQVEAYLTDNKYAKQSWVNSELEKYWKIDADGNLRTTFNIVVEGGGAFGEGATSGGGTSGGLGSVAIRTEGGIEYKSNANGVVTVPNWITASALNGYATESYVTSRGYITGITSAMVTAALGYTPYNSASFTKANIKSTLGIADWALAATKPAYTASEVGALPLSGGTMDGAVVFKSSAPAVAFLRESGTPYIRFGATTSLGYGEIGANSNGDAVFYSLIASNSAYGKWNTLIHSGNYSSYALPLSGGTISGTLQIGKNDNTSYNYLRLVRNYHYAQINNTGTAAIFSFGDYTSGTTTQEKAISIEDSGIYYVVDNSKSYPILHSNNYSSYALPLSGGTISATTNAPLIVNCTTPDAWSGIRFKTDSNTVGGLGVRNGTPVFINKEWNAVYPIIHSGNYSDYALPLSGGTISGQLNVANINGYTPITSGNYTDYVLPKNDAVAYLGVAGANNITGSALGYTYSTTEHGGKYAGGIISFGTNNYYGQINSSASGSQLAYRYHSVSSGYSEWRDIAFIDSNVASATKLQTASGMVCATTTEAGNVLIGTTTDSGNAKLRVNGKIQFDPVKLWGRSFDGSADVSGSLRLGNNEAIRVKDSAGVDMQALVLDTTNLFAVGYGTAANGYTTRIYGNIVSGYYNNGEKLVEGIRLNSTGNVLIGTTTDNSTDKLQVGGSALIKGNLTVTGGGAFGSDARYKHILGNANVDLETISNAPLFDYKWTDREDNKTYLGTTAQYWLDTAFGNAVNTSNPDFFHLDYGALGVGIGIAVAREVKGVKTEVEQLREEVKELKEKLNKYEQIWHN